MARKLLLLCLFPALVACTRVPTGVFGTADGSDAVPAVIDGNSAVRDERDLKRLKAIDESINDSLARLDAALDPNAEPADLDKLVVGDTVDPALLNDRSLRQQVEIEQKFDEKNQALIDDTRSGNLDQVESNSGLDPADFNNRDLRQQAQVDQKLDEKAAEVAPDKATDSSSESQDKPAPEPQETESSTPSL